MTTSTAFNPSVTVQASTLTKHNSTGTSTMGSSEGQVVDLSSLTEEELDALFKEHPELLAQLMAAAAAEEEEEDDDDSYLAEDTKALWDRIDKYVKTYQFQASLSLIQKYCRGPNISHSRLKTFYHMDRHLKVVQVLQKEATWIPSLKELLQNGPAALEKLHEVTAQDYSIHGLNLVTTAPWMCGHAAESAALIPMLGQDVMELSMRCILLRYWEACRVVGEEFSAFAGRYEADQKAIQSFEQLRRGNATIIPTQETSIWHYQELRDCFQAVVTHHRIANIARLHRHEPLLRQVLLGKLGIVDAVHQSMQAYANAQELTMPHKIEFQSPLPGFIPTDPKLANLPFLQNMASLEDFIFHKSGGRIRVIELSESAAVAKDWYMTERQKPDSIVAVNLEEVRHLGGSLAMGTNAESGGATFGNFIKTGYLQVKQCIELHNFVMRYHVGISTLFSAATGFTLRTMLMMTLQNCVQVNKLLQEYGGDRPGVENAIRMQRMAEKHGINARNFFNTCCAPVAMMLLEEECKRIEPKLHANESLDQIDEAWAIRSRSIEATKRFVAAYAILVQLSARIMLYLTDPSYCEYASTRDDKDKIDTQGEIMQTATTLYQAIFRILSAPDELFRPVSLATVATMFFSISYPRENRVFLSHRGPDLKAKLVDAVTMNLDVSAFGYSDTSPAAPGAEGEDQISFFLDALTPSRSETNHGFLWRELWESTHLNVSLSKNYLDSNWCQLEVFAWRLLNWVHRWRSTSKTYDDDDAAIDNDTETKILEGPVTEKEPLSSHTGIFHNNAQELRAAMSRETDRVGGDLLVFNELSRADLLKLASRMQSFQSDYTQFRAGDPDEPQLLFSASIRSLRETNRYYDRINDTHNADWNTLDSSQQQEFAKRWMNLHSALKPGSSEFVEALDQIRQEYGHGFACGHNNSIFYLYRAYHLARGRGVEDLTVNLIDDKLGDLSQICTRYSILTSNDDVDLFLGLLDNLQSTDDAVLSRTIAQLCVRDGTSEQLIRMALLLLLSNLSIHPCLIQLRSEPLTYRTVAGLPLKVLPCVTGDSWDEVDRLVRLRRQLMDGTTGTKDLPTAEEKKSRGVTALADPVLSQQSPESSIENAWSGKINEAHEAGHHEGERSHPKQTLAPLPTTTTPNPDDDLLTQFRKLASDNSLDVATVSHFLELCNRDVEAAVEQYFSESIDV